MKSDAVVAIVLVMFLLGAVGVGSSKYTQRETEKCNAKGGVLVQERGGEKCIRRDAVIPL